MGITAILGRLAIALVAAAAVVGVAIAALYLTTAPEIVSLLAQPVSLLLLPGLAVAMGVAQGHDFSSGLVVSGAFGVYFVIFFSGLLWRGWTTRFARRSAR